MPIAYQPDQPDLQSIKLVLPDSDNVAIDRWTSYEFSTDFLTPADSFHFELGLDEGGLPEDQKDALRFGARLELRLESATLAAGRIDALEVSTDRNSGGHYTVRGRDALGQALDIVADPTFQLKEGGTLAELLKRLFAPLGWTDDSHFEIDPAADREARSGIRGKPMTRGGKKKAPKPLKSFVLHQTKPYNHESVFHFASRVAQRHGLWIWASADGKKLIVGKPDFDQEAVFELRRSADGHGNILSGSVSYDMTDQPSMILADGFSGGGEFGKSRIRAYAINPILGLDDNGNEIPEIAKVLETHKGAVKVDIPKGSFLLRGAGIPFRPMFLHDDESKTQEQLENFVKREMSLLVRKAVSAHYVVEGHGQTINGNFVAWAVDTVVHVVDDAADLEEDLYVLGVHFSKSRSGGTTTRLDLVRLGSITF
jgi:prophage tail gpP-like protein